MAWFLVQTKVRQEALAERNLARQGYTTFLPVEPRTVRHARRVQTVLSAYFPGYVFVSLDPARQQWRPINSTLGVRALVTVRGRPSQVPDTVIDALKALVGPSGQIETADTLAAGDRVRIQSGPFADLVGEVIAVPAETRVTILLDAMANPTPVDLNPSQARKTP